VIARLLDRYGFPVHEERFPPGTTRVPDVCVHGTDAYVRAPARDDPGEPHVKCYLIDPKLAVYVTASTASGGYQLGS
jgi:hypothetical protein